MTKRINRKYLICVEEAGMIFVYKVKKEFRCGTHYHTLPYKTGKVEYTLTNSDVEGSVVTSLTSANYLRTELIRYFRNTLKRGNRPKVFIKRFHESDLDNFK